MHVQATIPGSVEDARRDEETKGDGDDEIDMWGRGPVPEGVDMEKRKIE
jgi:hypothetical protein